MTANDMICDAIKNWKVLSLTYDNTRRTVEPHMLGYDPAGELTLFAYQLTGTGPGFRTFHIHNAKLLSTTGVHFAGPRQYYNPRDARIHRVIYRL